MRIRHYSSGATRRRTADWPNTTAATKTLLVFVAAAAASGLGAVSAFGLGGHASSPLIGRALAAGTSNGGGGSGGVRENTAATAVAMTAKPSQVFVAGATGRLGQRVVR